MAPSSVSPEAGNVWLSAERTPIYEFYQFWRNVADDDVERFLKFFTFLPVAKITALCAEGGQALNKAKEVLAVTVTTMIHGEEAAQRSRDDARKAFGGAQDVTGDSIPHSDLPSAELADGIGLINLIVRGALAGTNSEARRLIQGGGVRIGDDRQQDVTAVVSSEAITDGYVLLRVGKKKLHRFDVQG